jgi:thiosulfate/3-mercaptopyruvate sulfurtransferase
VSPGADPDIAPIVSTDWLAGQINSPDIRVVDASWYLPASRRDPRAEFLAAHIPGAVYLDLDRVSDQTSSLPHMMPAPEQFAREVGSLGIGSAHHVVVYDGSGANLSAARAWYMFRVFGHDRVSVLDGGMGKWRKEGRPVEAGEARVSPARFTARFNPRMVQDIADLQSNLTRQGAQVVDARSPGRFSGSEPEPRPGLRGGHIPGSRNLPYGTLVSADGTLLPAAELVRRFQAAEVDLDRPIVTSCGSGVSACAILLALETLGHRDYAVYDGSWTEWGGREDTPVARGSE